jgi:anti-sigma factor ChrR (cupin superfamily)
MSTGRMLDKNNADVKMPTTDNDTETSQQMHGNGDENNARSQDNDDSMRVPGSDVRPCRDVA